MEHVIAFSVERVIAFSIEHVLVQNVLQFHRNFGVPAAFHFVFHLRSSNAFTVRLLLSGTVNAVYFYSSAKISKSVAQNLFTINVYDKRTSLEQHL